MAVTNKAASVLARLKNQAKQQHINYQICLQCHSSAYGNYKQNERFL